MNNERPATPDVVVVGSVHMDLIARAAHLPGAGQSLLGDGFSMHPGGKAGNQAVAAAQQGARTAIVARVGTDALGRELRDALARKQVDVSRLEMVDGEPTGVSPVLMAANGDYASIIIPGASGKLTPDSLARSSGVIGSCSVLLLQFEIALETSIAAAHHAKTATVIVNASPAMSTPDDLQTAMWSKTDVLIVNRDEGALLAAAVAHELGNPIRVANVLRTACGVGAVIITLGADGAALADGSTSLVVPGHAVSVADFIGAGDAFAGAFGAAVARGVGIGEAVTWGNAAGALAVAKSGAHDAAATLAETAAFMSGRPSSRARHVSRSCSSR